MTLIRHENGAGATPTCGRRRRRTALHLRQTEGRRDSLSVRLLDGVQVYAATPPVITILVESQSHSQSNMILSDALILPAIAASNTASDDVTN